MYRNLTLLTFLALCACSQPFEGRISRKLESAGIPGPMAQCMAHRWVRHLSVLQLRKIEQVSSDVSREYRGRTLTIIGFLGRVQQMDDPEIVDVVTASAARCALRL